MTRPLVGGLHLDEMLVLVFLFLLVVAGWASDGSSGLEPLHNSRLTLLTLLTVVGCLPLLLSSVTTAGSSIVFVRAWLPLILGLLCYENLKHLHANNITLALGIAPFDPLMLRIDEWLFGAAAPLHLEGMIHPMLTAYLQSAYTWFYYLMPVVVLLIFYLRASLDAFIAIRKAVIYCLLGGYASYLLIPVAGPLFLVGDQFTVPLNPNGALATLVFDTLRYNWDCFPSLHTSIPVLLTLLVWRFVSMPLRLTLLLVTASVVFSTVYLRVHYGIDVIAGIAWAGIIYAFVGKNVSGYTSPPALDRALRADRLGRFSTPAMLCFMISGACALTLEQVFEKILSTIIGSTTESSALVLTVFFAGLALGAGGYRFLAPRVRRPFLFYGVMESLVGLWALLTALNFGALHQASAVLYVEMYPLLGSVASKLICASLWILLPTMVMGLSLPAVTHFLNRHYGDTNLCQAEINSFYGMNILGGALAAFIAPYVAFPHLGLDNTLIGCFVIATIVLVIARHLSRRFESTDLDQAFAGDDSNTVGHTDGSLTREARGIIAFAGLSGFLFFGLEVLWIHLSATVIGTSVYAFANTLLAVLAGLYMGNRLVFKATWPDLELNPWLYQRLISGCVIILAVTFSLWDNVPRVFVMVGPYVGGFWSGEFVRGVLLFVLVATPAMFIGSLFPALFRMPPLRDAGAVRMISFVSVANAIGSVAGAAVCGLWLLPVVGSENLYKLLITALAIALVCFSWRYQQGHPERQLIASGIAISVVTLLTFMDWDYREITAGYNVYFDGRRMVGNRRIRYLHESPSGGVTTVVDTTQATTDGEIRRWRTLLTNGKFQGNDAWEVEAQVGFALIPILHTHQYRDALVVGLGTGQTANVVHQMGFAKIDIAEVSPGIAAAARNYFDHINGNVLEQDGVALHFDDGRHLLQRTSKRYDLITVEISAMWFNGSTNLYSAEFFALAAERLNANGVFQQWLQLHHISDIEVSSVIASVRSVFAHVEFWIFGGQGVVIASKSPLQRSPEMLRRAAESAMIENFGDGFLKSVGNARFLDESAVDRLSRATAARGVVINNDSNRYIEFWSPRYNLTGINYPKLNREYLTRFAAPPDTETKSGSTRASGT